VLEEVEELEPHLRRQLLQKVEVVAAVDVLFEKVTVPLI